MPDLLWARHAARELERADLARRRASLQILRGSGGGTSACRTSLWPKERELTSCDGNANIAQKTLPPSQTSSKHQRHIPGLQLT